MEISDQIIEISVGAILCGTLEVVGLGYIVNATGFTGVVQTMFTSVLAILIVVADVYVFMAAVRHAKKAK